MRQTLLNTIPKAIVYHQVKFAEEKLLTMLHPEVASMDEVPLGYLLGEDPAATAHRKQLNDRMNMLRKAHSEISNFQG